MKEKKNSKGSKKKGGNRAKGRMVQRRETVRATMGNDEPRRTFFGRDDSEPRRPQARTHAPGFVPGEQHTKRFKQSDLIREMGEEGRGRQASRTAVRDPYRWPW